MAEENKGQEPEQAQEQEQMQGEEPAQEPEEAQQKEEPAKEKGEGLLMPILYALLAAVGAFTLIMIIGIVVTFFTQPAETPAEQPTSRVTIAPTSTPAPTQTPAPDSGDAAQE